MNITIRTINAKTNKLLLYSTVGINLVIYEVSVKHDVLWPVGTYIFFNNFKLYNYEYNVINIL